MELYSELRRSGIVTDDTVLALHDTNLHPHKFVGWAYLIEPRGFVHQAVERRMVNDFKGMGYDAFSLHTKLSYHGPHLPYRHGVTILSKHRKFRNRRRADGPERASPFSSPHMPELPAPEDTVAAVVAPPDADLAPSLVEHDDIRLLVGSNKDLQREVASLQVRCWRDEETIEALEKELEQARDARVAAAQRTRELAAEVATLHAQVRPPFAAWLGKRPRSAARGVARRQILGGDDPFFKRGFLLDETAAIAGTSVKRIKSAPSSTMIYGPYVKLPAGRYAVTIDARLYQRLPVLANFKVDVVCDGAQRVVEYRDFRLHSLARWRRFELPFTVWDGEDFPDFEIRVWAREQTPLEIGGIGIYALAEEAGAAL